MEGVEKLFEEVLQKYENEVRCYIEDNFFGQKKYEAEEALKKEIAEYRERYYNLWWT